MELQREQLSWSMIWLRAISSSRVRSLLFLSSVLLGFVNPIHAIDIRIRLFSHTQLKSVKLGSEYQAFYLLAAKSNGEIIDTIFDLRSKSTNTILDLQVSKDQILLKQGASTLGSFDRLILQSVEDSSVFNIRNGSKLRIYHGKLDVWVDRGDLLVVNEVDLDRYVEGVVESEGGHVPAFEYFQAQAVLARTFAIRNWNKHSSNGYNLKDDVSSQVYHHMAYLQNSSNIKWAVRMTQDTIAVDDNCQPIQALFHANSGGTTAASEDAWQSKIEYLRSIDDPYSLKGPSAYWEKRIPQKELLTFLGQRMSRNLNDIALKKELLNLPKNRRVPNFKLGDRKLKMRDIRYEFKLRSAFFSVEEDGDDFILHGRGFGHGVGMSQDGAMEMAKQGLCYKDILSFYYSGIQLDALSAYID